MEKTDKLGQLSCCLLWILKYLMYKLQLLSYSFSSNTWLCPRKLASGRMESLMLECTLLPLFYIWESDVIINTYGMENEKKICMCGTVCMPVCAVYTKALFSFEGNISQFLFNVNRCLLMTFPLLLTFSLSWLVLVQCSKLKESLFSAKYCMFSEFPV